MENHQNNADVTVPVGPVPAPDGYDEPQGDLEQAISQLWKELFQVERVGRNDNFFELGGNSLLGMDLSEMFLTRLALEIPVVAIFQNPTIREIAQVVAP